MVLITPAMPKRVIIAVIENITINIQNRILRFIINLAKNYG